MVISQRKAIQIKLMAATSMLLVACIMLISASYAWFTLSTAPEITGITTNVGANGNLEIALATTETWNNPENVLTTTSKNDNVTVTNTTWGNLVTLSDPSYGLDGITLMPARLSYANGFLGFNPLYVPEYGTDGRVSSLVPATYGMYGAKGYESSVLQQRGVNAIGVASGMTDRQAAYRNLKANFSDGATGASGTASNTLTTYGSTLASIAVNYGLIGDGATYNQTQYDAVVSVLTALEGIKADLDVAWEDAVLAYAASNKGEDVTAINTEETFLEFQEIFKSENGYTYDADAKTVTVAMSDGTSVVITLPESFVTFKSKTSEIDTAIANAKAQIISSDATEYDGNYTWAEISKILTPLINTTGIKVNGYTVDQIKTDKNLLIQSLGSGIVVQLSEDSGVFYDIAALCGNYSVNIILAVEEYGIDNLPATMKTDAKTVLANTVMNEINTAGEPEGKGEASNYLTDLYGYQIDFLLRTNASNSDLLLQQEGTQRIYDDSTNTETLGLGSTMTFQSSSSTFGVTNMIDLMKNIRVVFTDKDNKIVGIAVLDIDYETTTTDGTTTTTYIGKGSKVDEATSTITACLKLVDCKFVDGVLVPSSITDKYAADENQVLIENMPANTAVKLSALVYLDGDAVTNADVANAATSMTGALNLQFASSATLVPMDNTALKGEATSSETPSGS